MEEWRRKGEVRTIIGGILMQEQERRRRMESGRGKRKRGRKKKKIEG